MTDNRNISIFCFLGSIAILIIYHIYFYYGHFGFDDMHYARLSHDFLNGHIDWTDHYSFRIIPIAFTALSYLIFGINDWGSSIPALALSGVILYLFYREFKSDYRLLALSSVLYFGFKWNLFFSDKLMPDLYVSAFAFIAWLGVTKRHSPSKFKYYSLISSIALFAAFNSKGTIVLCLPLLLIYLIYDLKNRVNLNYWKWFSIWSTGLGVAYLLYFKIAHGDALLRFQTIRENQYLNSCSYDQMGWKVLTDRLTNDYLSMLYTEGYWIYLLFVFVAILLFSINKKFTGLKWVLPIIILFMSCNFMTISFTSYNPVCLDIRHILFVSPIVIYCFIKYIEVNKTVLKSYKRLTIITILAMSIYLNYFSLQYAIYCRNMQYPNIRDSYYEISKTGDPKQPDQIICSPVFKNLVEYYSGFNNNRIQLFDLNNIEDVDFSNDLFLANNWYADWHSGLDQQSMKDKLSEYNLVVSENVDHGNEHVAIYRVVRDE